MARVGGIISAKVGGVTIQAKGAFTWNVGQRKREGVVGSDGLVHGYKETPQVPFIEGAITVVPGTNVLALLNTTGSTVTLELASGQTVALSDAFYAGEGTGNTEEGELPVRFEGSEAVVS